MAMSDSAKHKKAITEPLRADVLIDTLAALTKSIMRLDNKQQHIVNDWLVTWSKYLDFEGTFDPRRLVYYKRGDIVLAHFGYNVGNELGGVHYAIVVECDNNLTSGIVTVVPLSSLEDGKTENDLHKSEICLGRIIGDVDCYAMPLQMRPISKLRIIKPKHKAHGKMTVSGKLLNKIDEQLQRNFTKQKESKNET